MFVADDEEYSARSEMLTMLYKSLEDGRLRRLAADIVDGVARKIETDRAGRTAIHRLGVGHRLGRELCALVAGDPEVLYDRLRKGPVHRRFRRNIRCKGV